MIRELDAKIDAIDEELVSIRSTLAGAVQLKKIRELKQERTRLLALCSMLTPDDKVFLARRQGRPGVRDYIEALFDDFIELKGDRLFSDDASILGGLAFYHGLPVTLIGHRKGKNLEENLKFNFAMPGPEGYRKALRLMQQAEKFGRPIITFIDTPGAYPGLEAEARGQSRAIAQNLAVMSALRVPIVSIITGEGGSGGALALGVCDQMLMLEHAVYSVLSPEGFASILWKDSSRSREASSIMKLTAQDLLGFGIIDEVVPEPLGGAHRDPKKVFKGVDAALSGRLFSLLSLPRGELVRRRYEKFRVIGTTAKKEGQ